MKSDLVFKLMILSFICKVDSALYNDAVIGYNTIGKIRNVFKIIKKEQFTFYVLIKK